MARLASQAVGGYYPTPPHLLPAIAARVGPLPPAPRLSRPRYTLLDPCAGDGAALLALAHALFGNPLPLYNRGSCDLGLYTCELEARRAAALRERFQASELYPYQYEARQGDAFLLDWATDDRTRGVDLLFLNPPYDLDPLAGRLEHAFLTRLTPVLAPGSGLLLFLLPGSALAASAEFLAVEYSDLACFRFPDPDYAVYKQ